MSHIDVREIKLNLRYPNSRQEDITDAFMRGYQGAVKIGNDAVRRVKAEKETLIRRIDELCAENERLRQENAKLDELLPENGRWFSFDVVRSLSDERDQLADENDKLRKLCWRMRTYMTGVVEHNSYQIMTTGYTMLGGRIKECDEAMQALGIEVDE